MIDTIKHIKYKEIDYPLVFNLNVIEKIQDKYGSYEKWGEMTDGKEREINIGALKFGILEMINEGIDIENENKDEKQAFVNSKIVGRIITDLGLKEMAEKANEIVINSTKVENTQKNA